MLHIFLREHKGQMKEESGQMKVASKRVQRKSLLLLCRARATWAKPTENKSTQILPRRRGSGSDEVDDEGVETRGKAEIAKRIIACCEYLSTPSALVIRLMLVPLQRWTAIFAYTNPLRTPFHPTKHFQKKTVTVRDRARLSDVLDKGAGCLSRRRVPATPNKER